LWTLGIKKRDLFDCVKTKTIPETLAAAKLREHGRPCAI
jgi:hypothetical protein